MSVKVMNLGGDYAVETNVCVFCSMYPKQVTATCFGIREGEEEPTFGCDGCCYHGAKEGEAKVCAPVGELVACGVCTREKALLGTSYCYGCGTHVCPDCVERAPVLPERHPKGAHPPPPQG